MRFLNKKFSVSDFEITVREIIVSICIFVFMMLIGMSCSANIEESEMENNEKYTKALRIESTDLFQHGMNTNVGNAFVYGDLKAVDTVTYPEIDGEYMYIKKVKEEYTKHYRTVTKTRTKANGEKETYTEQEEYWTWDPVQTWWEESTTVEFCGVTFDMDKFVIPGSNHITTIKKTSHVRYVYYGTDPELTGTIFTDLRDKTISDNTEFYNNTTIEDACEHLTQVGGSTLFWIFWIPLTAVLILLFYIADNKWLH